MNCGKWREAFYFGAVWASFGVPAAFSQDAPDLFAPTAATESTARSSVSKILPPALWGEDYQIRAFGGESYTRAVFASYSRELREDFRNLVYRYRIDDPSPIDRDAWAIPVRIELRGSPDDVYTGDAVRRRVMIGPDDRFVIYVYTKLHDNFEEEEFRKELLAALILEQMLIPFAASPAALPVEKIDIPSWLIEGFDQMIEHRRSGRPSAFYQGFLESGQMLDPNAILETQLDDRVDPVSLAIFRASSSALLEALLDQEDGDVAMRSLLGDFLVVDRGKFDVLLRQHFPALREIDEGLDKWWALQIAALGQQQRLEFLDREETERWLDEALTIEIDDKVEMPRAEPVKTNLLERLRPKKPVEAKTREPFYGTIMDYQQFLDRPSASEKLSQAFDKLERLKRTGFPAYRPVIDRYETIILKLRKKQTKSIEEDFRNVTELRGKIGETLEQAEDYMNYFEATRAPQRSQAFDDYLEMRRRLEKRKRPGRTDRISRYMDSLEREFR